MTLHNYEFWCVSRLMKIWSREFTNDSWDVAKRECETNLGERKSKCLCALFVEFFLSVFLNKNSFNRRWNKPWKRTLRCVHFRRWIIHNDYRTIRNNQEMDKELITKNCWRSFRPKKCVVCLIIINFSFLPSTLLFCAYKYDWKNDILQNESKEKWRGNENKLRALKCFHEENAARKKKTSISNRSSS